MVQKNTISIFCDLFKCRIFVTHMLNGGYYAFDLCKFLRETCTITVTVNVLFHMNLLWFLLDT